jgi:AraC-like DNA-binding protein
LADPNLSLTTLAAAHHISIRQLQKLFATQGLTISGWIRERRLERARRDLANPAQPNVPITAIADRWMFANSAHFSRVFKAAYNISPRDYRHEHLIVPTLVDMPRRPSSDY